MRIASVVRLVSVMVMMYSLTLIPPMMIDIVYHEKMLPIYLFTATVSLLLGGGFWILTKDSQHELKIRDGFLVVMLFWVVLSLLGTLPFIMGAHPVLGVLDGLFESVSGWTTTGSTVISGIEHLPHSLLYYRQQLQFLGGMGIIVLAVAVLPMLGVGGMQLYQAEMPGPLKDHKLTPRIAETAKSLWIIYGGLTACCILAYLCEGMSWFNAVGEAFSTVSTGGFSTHDDSFAHYSNHAIHWTAILFMLLSSLNYGLHFMAFRKGEWRSYFQDMECISYMKALITVCVVVITVLLLSDMYKDQTLALLHGIFTTVSVMTTTGLTMTDFEIWPAALTVLLLWFGFIGGCAASTTGGLKQIRMMLMRRQSWLAFWRLIHPQAVCTLRFSGKTISWELMQSVSGFVYVYFAIFIVLLFLLMIFGLDLATAVSCLVASLANVGVAVGHTGFSFAELNDPSKIILLFAMFVGRLEIFTVLVLIMPEYWRK